MEQLVEVLAWSQAVAYVALGWWTLGTLRRHGDERSRWLAATFGTFAVIFLFSRTIAVLEDGVISEAAADVAGRPVMSLLALFPYLLLRFLDAFEPVGARARRVAGWLALALMVVALVIEYPDVGEPWDVPFWIFAGLLVGTWVVIPTTAGSRFWRAGHAQPTLARRRLRLISVAVVALSLSSVALASSRMPSDGARILSQVLALSAGVLLLVGFAPPRWLRQLWRQPEEQALHTAALQLMATVRVDEVAMVLAPHLRSVVAARGVALVHHRQLLGTDGVAVADEAPAAIVAAAAGDAGSSVGGEVIRQPLRDGAIVVWTDRYTPFFGEEELQLLQRIGLLADLALHRADLLASEQEARDRLAGTNAELEAFVYSASHDLKSPLIAMLSYVDLLAADHRDDLDEEARWFLDRLVSNGRYMEALIGDLLELSRVGRTMLTPERVELGELLGDLATELTATFPGTEVVVGDVPVLWANGTRVRQLFQNLLENAAKHGHDSVRIEVTAAPTDDGGVELVVRDDGPGIPRPYRERVFGVFERLEVQDAGSGTGIGLAICRKVVESLGGRIWLAERDDGAEFRIALPPAVLIEQTASTEEVPAWNGPSASWSPRTTRTTSSSSPAPSAGPTR